MNSPLVAALTRRRSFVTPGTASLGAALAGPFVASAKKHKKHTKQLKSDALCKKQIGQCLDFFTPACGDDPACLATANRCCPTLGACGFTEFFTCVSESVMTEQAGLTRIP